MKDNDLIDLLATKIEEGLASAGLSLPVIQLEQPTQQGVEENAIYLQKLFDQEYGWAQNKKTINTNPDKTITSKDTQQVITPFQISIFYQIIPDATASQPTASDILNYLKAYLNHRTIMSQFRAAGVGVLRIVRISNDAHHNDYSQFQLMPLMQIDLVHTREIGLNVDSITSLEGKVININEVNDGN